MKINIKLKPLSRKRVDPGDIKVGMKLMVRKEDNIWSSKFGACPTESSWYFGTVENLDEVSFGLNGYGFAVNCVEAYLIE
jgi:hypothetical protein